MESNSPITEAQISALIASRILGPKTVIYTDRNDRPITKELEIALSFPPERDKARQALESWQSRDIFAVALEDHLYPEALKQIPAPPLIFYYRRDFPALDPTRALSIVGARRADPIGIQTARSFAASLSSRGIQIVSGLALGIDAAAHLGAMDSTLSNSTFAVLGSGVDLIYPSSHHNLAQKILDSGGALLSHFEPGTKPFPSNFLDRNRLIAALSQGVLVIQASMKSGSLVTARYGIEQGRDVMVIPGAITDHRFEGSNNLIKQGAHLVTSVQDVLEILPALPNKIAQDSSQISLSPEQSRIISALQRFPSLHFDQLRKEVNHAQLDELILELELAGILTRLPGNFLALLPNH